MCARPVEVEDAEILDAVDLDSDPVATAQEIADRIEIGERATLSRLKNLKEENKVRSKEVGKQYIWWIPSSATPDNPEKELKISNIASTNRLIRDSVKSLDLPGTDVVLELRQLAVQMAIDYVNNQDKADLEKIVDHLIEVNPAGYKYDKSSLRDLIKNSVRQIDGFDLETESRLREIELKKNVDKSGDSDGEGQEYREVIEAKVIVKSDNQDEEEKNPSPGSISGSQQSIDLFVQDEEP